MLGSPAYLGNVEEMDERSIWLKEGILAGMARSKEKRNNFLKEFAKISKTGIQRAVYL
jgi:hypothetical protein